MTENISETVQD